GLWIPRHFDDRGAHRRQVDDRRHPREVLEHDPTGDEGDLHVGDGSGVVCGDGTDRLFFDRRIVEIAQSRLEQDLDRIRQVLRAFDRVEARYASRSERRLESRISLKRVSGHVVLSFDSGPPESRDATPLPRQGQRKMDPNQRIVTGTRVMQPCPGWAWGTRIGSVVAPKAATSPLMIPRSSEQTTSGWSAAASPKGQFPARSRWPSTSGSMLKPNPVMATATACTASAYPASSGAPISAANSRPYSAPTSSATRLMSTGAMRCSTRIRRSTRSS